MRLSKEVFPVSGQGKEVDASGVPDGAGLRNLIRHQPSENRLPAIDTVFRHGGEGGVVLSQNAAYPVQHGLGRDGCAALLAAAGEIPEQDPPPRGEEGEVGRFLHLEDLLGANGNAPIAAYAEPRVEDEGDTFILLQGEGPRRTCVCA